MMAKKWDYKTKTYEDYELPEDAKILADMDEVIPCAQCKRPHMYGDMYTSRQIHNALGFGYGVCEMCYQEEWKQELEAELAPKSLNQKNAKEKCDF